MCNVYDSKVRSMTLPSVAAVGVLAGWNTPRQNENDSVDVAVGHIPTSVSMSRENKWNR